MDPDYFEKWNYADRRLGVGSMYWFARRYYARLIRRAAPAAVAGRPRELIELGCGLGDLLALLQDDFACTGVDPLDTAVRSSRAAAPRATVVHADQTWLETVTPASVDVVVSLHVVEHLGDPAATLTAVGRILRPGGVAVIATPNPDYRLRRFKDPATDSISKDPTHINVHPASVWRTWTEQAGLRIDRHYGDGLWDVPYFRVVPAPVQLAILGLPALAQVLTTGTWMPVSLGVNQVLVARAPGDR